MKPEERREQRINALLIYIRDVCKGKTSLHDVYRFAYRNWGYGLKVTTINSYINALILAGEVKLNNDHIIAVKKPENVDKEEAVGER